MRPWLVEFPRVIPEENRARLAAIHDGISDDMYRTEIWIRRDLKQGYPKPISGGWPVRRVPKKTKEDAPEDGKIVSIFGGGNAPE